MRKHLHRFGLLGTVLAFTALCSSTALALPGHGSADTQVESSTSTSSTGETSGSPGKVNPSPRPKVAEAKDDQIAHREEAKQKACQNKQKAIHNIMARIANRGQKQLTLFGTIATRVENFYTTKGKTLSNYDALVADTNAKQAAAQSAVDAVKTASTSFSCDNPNPRAFVDSFKSSLKSEVSALKDYRTSVKNLTVGVKSVESTTKTDSNTSTESNASGSTTQTQTTTGGNQ